MIRPLAAATAFATLALVPFAGPGTASAQTWGQPIYLNAYGRPVGGSPLSEVQTRAYLETGRRADGYSERPRAYVPVRGYDRAGAAGERGYGYPSPGYHRHGHDPDRYRGGASRDHRSPASGYRDAWGYDDDRPPTSSRGDRDRRRSDGSPDRGYADVYFYDR